MHKIPQAIIKLLRSFQGLSLLFMRLILAYGFYEPAVRKLSNFDATVASFTNNLHLPYPYLSAVLAATAEALGVVFLALGLKTRLICVPLMVTMLVAITVVHWKDGFAASANGYEIPLYYFIMLFVLATTGPGKYSLDETALKKWFGTN
jgi:putative oxidoreductase